MNISQCFTPNLIFHFNFLKSFIAQHIAIYSDRSPQKGTGNQTLKGFFLKKLAIRPLLKRISGFTQYVEIIVFRKRKLLQKIAKGKNADNMAQGTDISMKDDIIIFTFKVNWRLV